MGNPEKTNTGGQEEDFPSTNWRELSELKQADQQFCGELINHLISRYWKPVYCFLFKKGFSSHTAKDLTQDFFYEVVLKNRLFQKADSSKGRLRTYLLACLNNYTANYIRKERAQRKRPNSRLIQLDAWVEPSNILISSEISPDQAYQISWIEQMLKETIERTREHCSQNGQMIHWQIFKSSFLLPVMENSPRPSMEWLCRQYNLKDQKQTANMLVTVKRIFRRFFYEKLAVSLDNPSEIEQEMEDILKTFK